MSDLFRNQIISSKMPPKVQSKSSKPEKYGPLSWKSYFDFKEDLETDVGTFRIYRRGIQGPLLFFLHGGGFSALSWAVLSKRITAEVKCQCLAMDIRGHGDTATKDDSDLSAETLAQDVRRIIMTMFPSEAPPIILIGHSMGGAITIHSAVKSMVPSLVGLVVIDVVEGSALEALYSMNSFLQSRPKSFRSMEHAIEWSLRTGHIRNAESARVSFPGQLKNVVTGVPATYDVEEKLLTARNDNSENNVGSNVQVDTVKTGMNSISETDEDESLTSTNLSGQNNTVISTKTKESSTNVGTPYTWRIDLLKTEKYWHGWFEGMSQMFLSVSQPKMLILAGIDRMDKDLTIGQMQGKFQMHIIPQSGHAVHEDAPEKVADCLASFLVRNRFTEARAAYEIPMPCC